MNLLQGATDRDGNTDLEDAVITGWPVDLGPKPTPLNRVISFTPTAPGNYTVNYQVTDALGLLSDNIGAGTITVIGAQDIAIGGAEYRARRGRRRWCGRPTYDAIIGANTPQDPRGTSG